MGRGKQSQYLLHLRDTKDLSAIRIRKVRREKSILLTEIFALVISKHKYAMIKAVK